MNKDDSSSDTQSSTEVLVTDSDPVQIGKSGDKSKFDTDGNTDGDTDSNTTGSTDTSGEAATGSKSESKSRSKTKSGNKPKSGPTTSSRGSRFGIFNFLLILCLAAAAAYYWWQQQQQSVEYQRNLAELRQQLSTKASNTSLAAGMTPLKTEIGGLGTKLGKLENEQQELRDASEKLYELFGRDKNDWQLAEVEYLMRVAQHKLILQNDFEGAAITLQAASDKIALTADPGLLPVRVLISDEIAQLKTRKRADLVGMTLILAQLGRQVQALKPGFAVRVDETSPAAPMAQDANWMERFNAFINSLIQVRIENGQPSEVEASNADIGETLADNLKLARWSVLERDARQYQQLIDQSLRLFREFYDLDNAANHDFMTELKNLQKMPLKPEKPDINGSLRELQRILAKREVAPEENPKPAVEASSEVVQ
jgi:uroporphyrin-3 C-methyltransferase